MTIIDQIKSLHQEMRSEIIACGVHHYHYDFKVKHIEKKSPEDLDNIFQLLNTIRQGPYQDLMKVRKFRNQDFWDGLELLFGEETFHEQTLLRAQQTKLRKAWYAKKTIQNNAENFTA